MIKLASIAAASLIVMATSSVASAQTWSPAAADGWTVSTGSLNLSQSISVSCGVTADAKTKTSTTGEIFNFTFVGTYPCGSLTAAGQPWQIEPIIPGPSGGDGIRIKNLYVTSTLGYCQGDVEGDWDDATQTLTFPVGTYVDGYVFGIYVPCYIDGSITLTPARSNALPLIVS